MSFILWQRSMSKEMTFMLWQFVFILKHILEILIILEKITRILFRQMWHIKGKLENFIRDHVRIFKNWLELIILLIFNVLRNVASRTFFRRLFGNGIIIGNKDYTLRIIKNKITKLSNLTHIVCVGSVCQNVYTLKKQIWVLFFLFFWKSIEFFPTYSIFLKHSQHKWNFTLKIRYPWNRHSFTTLPTCFVFITGEGLTKSTCQCYEDLSFIYKMISSNLYFKITYHRNRFCF